MKKVIAVMVVALMASVAAQAAEVSAYVDFASAYVFRGVTLNNGLVMQPGVEVSGLPIPEEYGSLAAGIWANYDFSRSKAFATDDEVTEIDYYVSYTLPIDALDVSVGYINYDYPSDSTVDNDEEISLSIGSAVGTNGLYVGITFNQGIGGYVDKSTYIEAALDYETELSDALTASAGLTVAYLISDGDIAANGNADGFHNATASVGLGYAIDENWSLSTGLTYIQQLDDEVLLDTEYDVNVVASVGISCDF
jgi:uncharacterized protein (TIGR02001 family)